VCGRTGENPPQPRQQNYFSRQQHVGFARYVPIIFGPHLCDFLAHKDTSRPETARTLPLFDPLILYFRDPLYARVEDVDLRLCKKFGAKKTIRWPVPEFRRDGPRPCKSFPRHAMPSPHRAWLANERGWTSVSWRGDDPEENGQPHQCAFAPCDAGTRPDGSIPPSVAHKYRMGTHIPRIFHP
jgi:hypothetical protein